MKSKKDVQIAAKKLHKETLKSSRKQEPNLVRNLPTKDEKPTILIVSEGENTEYSYFKQFRLTSAKVIPIGEGYNTISLVKRAIKLSKLKTYNQVWCVFDADPKPDNPKQAKNFNDAIKLAEKKNFGVAYSNQAFEYWIILHFEDHQGGNMDRSDYNKKLNKLIKPFKLEYDGNGSKEISQDFFEILNEIDLKTGKKRHLLAIERAKKIYNLFEHKNPAQEESSTTVFRLVEELMKYV